MAALRYALLVSALTALNACSQPAGSSPDAAGSGRNDMGTSSALAPAAHAPAPATEATVPKAAECADTIAVELDRSDAAAQEWKPYPARRLEAFRKAAADAFRAAANHACRANSPVARSLAPVRHILIQSGAGAAEPTFYRPDPGPRSELIFQYAFIEDDLALPDRDAIELGLRCWADAKRKECADMGD